MRLTATNQKMDLFMKQLWTIAGSLALLCAGCETKTQTGALAGAGGGALIGGLAGGGTGALIGAAAGAAGGALIGYAMDEHDKEVMQKNAPDTMRRIEAKQQLYVYDIENMVKNGIKDDVIIHEIQATNSVFSLTPDQIVDLKNQGVSQEVIDAMIQTGHR